jgi:phage repressor protein C with HTH and peptisase S24 domain
MTCMGIGQNIRYHRATRLGWTLEQLSAQTGVDVGTISALENRDSKRSMFFAPIASGLGITLEELQMDPVEWEKFGGKGKTFDAPQDSKKNKYPRVVGTAKMGDHGYYLDLDGGDGYVEFEAEEGSIAIQCRGDSMYPAIKDGWFVIIEPSGRPTADEYVLLNFKDGKKMVKNLLQIKGDCYVVESVNGGARFTAMKEDLEGIRAISAVVPPSKHKT